MPRKIREAGPTYAKLREAPRSAASAPEQTGRWDAVASMPDWRITREARAQLTNRLKPLVEGVSAIILEKVSETRIKTREFVLCAFSDPEEDWEELVFQIKVQSPPAEALALWDSIGDEIDRWKETLSKPLANMLAERIGVHVLWEEQGGLST